MESLPTQVGSDSQMDSRQEENLSEGKVFEENSVERSSFDGSSQNERNNEGIFSVFLREF